MAFWTCKQKMSQLVSNLLRWRVEPAILVDPFFLSFDSPFWLSNFMYITVLGILSIMKIHIMSKKKSQSN